MKKRICGVRNVVLCGVVVSLAGALGVSYARAPAGKGKAAKAPEGQAIAMAYTLSGPYTHKNLTIFLIHGKEKLKGTKILTREEALTQK